MPKKSSNSTQQEELGPRVSEKPQVLGIGENGEQRVSIIHKDDVNDFIATDTYSGRFAKKDGTFYNGVLINSVTQTVPGGHGVGTFTVKLDGSGEEIKIIEGKEVSNYFFKAKDPPYGGKNKRKNRKSTKSKKSKKSKKSRKNRKKTIRRR